MTTYRRAIVRKVAVVMTVWLGWPIAHLGLDAPRRHCRLWSEARERGLPVASVSDCRLVLAKGNHDIPVIGGL
jgi:hypothetical protein